jgi:hypothetical protein
VGDEQVPVLRLSSKAADAIRELAAVEGLSEGEMVEVAVSAYAALPSERRAAAKAALHDAPQPDADGEVPPDRASVAGPSTPPAPVSRRRRGSRRPADWTRTTTSWPRRSA